MAERNKTRRRYLPVAAALVMIAVLGAAASGLYAKYVAQAASDGVAIAPAFYFESNLLQENGAAYTLNADTTSFTFTLMNHADDLRYSEVDIDYTVSVTSKDDTNFTDPQITGTLKQNETSDATVTIENLSPGKTYTITATGKGGFEKTLTATITVRSASSNIYWYVTTDDPVVLLTIWTENASGDVTITYPNGLLPDNTWAGMENWKTGESKKISVDAYSSYTFRFIRTGGNTTSVPTVASESTITERKPQ